MTLPLLVEVILGRYLVDRLWRAIGTIPPTPLTVISVWSELDGHARQNRH